jgi:hypothetical protein
LESNTSIVLLVAVHVLEEQLIGSRWSKAWDEVAIGKLNNISGIEALGERNGFLAQHNSVKFDG